MKTRRAVRKKEPTVVGLDVSLVGPGVCLIVGDPRGKIGEDLWATTTLIRAGEDLRGPERLSVVTRAIWSWLAARGAGKPGDVYVMEGYAFSRSRAHSLGEIGGCVRRVVWESGGDLIVVPPSTLKRFLTGKGVGEKNVIIKHVYKRWGFDVDEDNQCDAFGCAVLGLIDRLGPEHWTVLEAEILQLKVERFSGSSQRSRKVRP